MKNFAGSFFDLLSISNALKKTRPIHLTKLRLSGREKF